MNRLKRTTKPYNTANDGMYLDPTSEYFEDRIGHDYLTQDEVRDPSAYYTGAAFGWPRTYQNSQFLDPPSSYWGSAPSYGNVKGQSVTQVLKTSTPTASVPVTGETAPTNVPTPPPATKMLPCDLIKRLHQTYDQDIRVFLPYTPLAVNPNDLAFDGAAYMRSSEVQKLIQEVPVFGEALIYNITQDMRLWIPGIWAGQYAPRIMGMEHVERFVLMRGEKQLPVEWPEGADVFHTEAGYFVAPSKIPVIALYKQVVDRLGATSKSQLVPFAQTVRGGLCEPPEFRYEDVTMLEEPARTYPSMMLFSGPNQLFQLIETIPAAIEAIVTQSWDPLHETASARLIAGDIEAVEDYLGNIADTLDLFA